jgi:protease-4
MNKKRWIGAAIAVAVFVITGLLGVGSAVLSNREISKSTEIFNDILEGTEDISLPEEDYIAVVTVDGTIQEQAETSVFEIAEGYQHDDTLEYIDELIDDENNQGILLYVDSPGGAVYESEELYEKLQEYKEETGRKIWGYMAHYAASGGYYVSMPADQICANPNTTTGSIGVIISGYDLTGLYEKLGIEYYSITSGENKDWSSLSDEQKEIYQSIVDESYDRFVEIVADGRNMDEKEVRKIADGRIYSAKQALNLNLIDEIGLYEDFKDEISEETDVYTFYSRSTETPVWAQLFSKISDVVPKSEAQVLTELKDEVGSGVPMYYAENLQ